jgi:hypothetical protein
VGSYFFDASGLVKRYVTEIGSPWVLGLTDPMAAHDLYVARVTGVEVVSALVRHVPALAAPLLSAAVTKFEQDFRQRLQLIELTDILVDRAMILAQIHRLRAYDAIQLAAGVELFATCSAVGAPLVFVSADSRLNAAAAAEGVTIEDPNQHP